MRRLLSKTAWRLAPDVMADRAHRHQQALHEEWGLSTISDDLVAAHGDRVVRGPFAGMRYPSDRIGSIPKRLGAYELELHGWLNEALAAPPARFVDIGAADGFYAVGIALRGIPVEAFEMARTARHQLTELAELNGTEVAVHGRASVDALGRMDFDDALVLSDCEGAEVDLFAPEVVDRLRSATVIVEVHESLRPGAGALLRERFAATHEVDVAPSVRREAAAFPELATLEPAQRQRAVAEARTGATPWFRMRPAEQRHVHVSPDGQD
jgi:hypothetical protein